MDCPHCQSEQVVKNGRESRPNGALVQRYRCRDCSKQFNERTGTPMARLRAPSSVIAAALNVRSEGMGVRAAARSFGKAHSTVLRWEERLAQQVEHWSPPAPEDREVTLEGDEVYTRVGENLPPPSSEGWTIHFIERSSRYWVSAQAGHKDELLFQRGTQQAWQWAQACPYIRWFTDGERRYAKTLWDLASIYLALRDCPKAYGSRKVWREGLEVAMKIKGSQGQRRVVWVKTEHPFTAISPWRRCMPIIMRLKMRHSEDGAARIVGVKTSMPRLGPHCSVS